MCFRFPDRNISFPYGVFSASILAIAALSLLSLAGCASKGQVRENPARTEPTVQQNRVLRVCADPNNLPFSNDRLEGFENRIAEVIASELNASVEYTWWAQRRGFFRNTLNSRKCDLVMGIPEQFDQALPTSPYYRSIYSFVYRKDRRLNIRSYDDPRLHHLKIGLQISNEDYAPPALALARRNILGSNIITYSVYGDYAEDNPPARIIDAVVGRDVDLAIVWGPLAGYFARQQQGVLDVVPVSPETDSPVLPMAFDISMGVRKGEQAFKEEIDQVLVRRREDIERILDEYGVPRVKV
jgi:mxaJ protein